MQVILKGSLRHFPPADVLRFLGAHRASGTLDIVSVEGPKVRMFLREGAVVFGEGSDVKDLVGIVAQATDFEEGAFALVDEVAVPEGAGAMAVEALLDAVAKQFDASRTFADHTYFRVVEVSGPQPQISMTGDEFKLILRIGTGRTFGELAEGHERRDLTATLRAMEERGLVARASGPPEPPAEKTQPGTMPLPPIESEMAPKKRRAAALTGDGGAAYALTDDRYAIGRDATTNAIAINDSSISTQHATLTRDGESFSLTDLSSRNGTFVNGEPVTAPRLLADNDVIRFGRVIFTFNLATEVKRGDTTERKMKNTNQ